MVDGTPSDCYRVDELQYSNIRRINYWDIDTRELFDFADHVEMDIVATRTLKHLYCMAVIVSIVLDPVLPCADEAGVIVDNKTCADLVTFSTMRECYVTNVETKCCAACASFANVTMPDCKYGDGSSTSTCPFILCGTFTNPKDCCASCNGISFGTRTTPSLTTPATTAAPTTMTTPTTTPQTTTTTIPTTTTPTKTTAQTSTAIVKATITTTTPPHKTTTIPKTTTPPTTTLITTERRIAIFSASKISDIGTAYIVAGSTLGLILILVVILLGVYIIPNRYRRTNSTKKHQSPHKHHQHKYEQRYKEPRVFYPDNMDGYGARNLGKYLNSHHPNNPSKYLDSHHPNNPSKYFDSHHPNNPSKHLDSNHPNNPSKYLDSHHPNNPSKHLDSNHPNNPSKYLDSYHPNNPSKYLDSHHPHRSNNSGRFSNSPYQQRNRSSNKDASFYRPYNPYLYDGKSWKTVPEMSSNRYGVTSPNIAYANGVTNTDYLDRPSRRSYHGGPSRTKRIITRSGSPQLSSGRLQAKEGRWHNLPLYNSWEFPRPRI